VSGNKGIEGMARTGAARVKKLAVDDPRGYEYLVVPLDLLLPDTTNPRIRPQETPLDAILALIEENAEGLYALAKDIVEQKGVSPGELLNVTPNPEGFYVVKEGNRRVAAQQILMNPEQLRGHIPSKDVERWKKLAKLPAAAALPKKAICVSGEDHDPWIVRRHQGPQGGVGVSSWNAEAKARHARDSLGKEDRALKLLDLISAHDRDRFESIRPAKGTFTTFSRVLDSEKGRAILGIDVNEEGQPKLLHGEKTLRMLEGVMRALRATGDKRLTSRTIHTSDDIARYLHKLRNEIPDDIDETPIILDGKAPSGSGKSGGSTTSGSTAKGSAKGQGKGTTDVLNGFTKWKNAKIKAIVDELRKARRSNLPTAAMFLTRAILDLSVELYAKKHTLPFAGDEDGALRDEIKAFLATSANANVTMSKPVRNVLLAGSKGKVLSLDARLQGVVQDFVKHGHLIQKEADAKVRELKLHDVVALLNDSAHRLDNWPSIDRVDHILQIVQSIVNTINADVDA
jgi:hypothetical protein